MRPRRAPILVALLVVAVAGTLGANEPEPQVPRFGTEVERLIAGAPGRTATWGILVVSLARGDTLFALNPSIPLAPASNAKLFTAAAALHLLGPDYRFPTFLLSDGEVRRGVLEGDLILYGTGDPSMSERLLPSRTAAFEAFARELAARGIHTVRGDLIGDGTFFQGPTRRESWNPRDLNDWFTAPASALSFNENVVTLRIQATMPGARPTVITIPDGAGLPLSNGGITSAGRPATPLLLVRDDPDTPIEIRGEMRMGQADVWRELTVADPAAYAASVLRTVLAEAGIRVLGPARSLRPDEASRVSTPRVVAPGFGERQGLAAPAGRVPVRTLAVHESPPLPELLEVVNKASHNLFAELLLFAMGRMVEGEGSFDGGTRAVTHFLIHQVGITSDELHIEDGSGLSRLNRASPGSLVRLLTFMAESEHAAPFYASLPEAGNRRELARMARTPAAGNLRAKTGTIDRVSALSGTVHTADGEPILFSIVVNNIASTYSAKRIEDQIGEQLARFTRPGRLTSAVPASPSLPALSDGIR